MGHKNAVFGDSLHIRGNLCKCGRVTNGFIVNSSKSCNEVGDGALWIYQARKFVDYLFAIKLKNGNLGDFVPLESISRGFDVDNRIQ